ncbi:cytidine deaminase [Porphyromonadaceae bacterium W3.11]|nr:cytidine deaminase [Porphyromonadaceae bacterium W3.11]
MKRNDIVIPVIEKAFEELSPNELELIEAARDIAKNAYAPYSEFRVGAAARLASGKIVSGSNQENAAYPSGICAERTTLYYAGAQYPNDPVTDLAITAIRKDGRYVQVTAPCGACRQVMLEVSDRFKQPFKVYLPSTDTTLIIEDNRQLLPINFDASSL